MKLEEFHSAIRIDVKDYPPDDTPQYSEDELNRALEKALGDLDRWTPREAVAEFTIEGGTLTETVTTVAKPESLSLANRLVKKGSVTISEGGNTYELDVDFEVDYYEGVIHTLGGGSIPDATVLTVTYTLQLIALDISSLEDLIIPQLVEYPVGQIPQEFASFSVWNNLLYITTLEENSQRAMQDNAHLAVYYHATHVMPTHDDDGSIPASLVEAIAKGSGAYLILLKATELELDADSDLELARSQLALIEASQAGISAALTNADTRLDEAITAIDGLNAQLLGASDSAAADLDTIPAILDEVDTDLSQVTTLESLALSDLAAIDGDITSAKGVLAGIAAKLAAADAALGNGIAIDSNLTEHFAQAASQISAAEPFMDKVNIGLDPASAHLRAADIFASMTVQTTTERNGWSTIGNAYNDSGRVLVDQALAHLEAASRRLGAAAVIPELEARRSELATTRLGKARVRVDQANARSNLAQALVGEANARVQAALGFVQLAAQYIQAVQQYVQAAQGYFQAAQITLETAEKFRISGNAKLEEFRGILADRNQSNTARSLVSVRQPR
jgi:hypothetical protein